MGDGAWYSHSTPPVTPRSYPNSRPPDAAMTQDKMTNGVILPG